MRQLCRLQRCSHQMWSHLDLETSSSDLEHRRDSNENLRVEFECRCEQSFISRHKFWKLKKWTTMYFFMCVYFPHMDSPTSGSTCLHWPGWQSQAGHSWEGLQWRDSSVICWTGRAGHWHRCTLCTHRLSLHTEAGGKQNKEWKPKSHTWKKNIFLKQEDNKCAIGKL